MVRCVSLCHQWSEVHGQNRTCLLSIGIVASQCHIALCAKMYGKDLSEGVLSGWLRAVQKDKSPLAAQ